MRARRLPVLDEYVEDGESATFVDGQVIALSELPTLVLASLGEEWRPVGELEPVLLDAFGAPAEGSVDAALLEVLQTLATHGLVELEDA